MIEPYRVSTEAIRASVASLPDAGRRDLATALQALSQLVAAINDCPEVDGTVDPDDADLVELAFEVVVPTWEAVGAVDADRQLTELGAWGLPRALARAWGSDLHAT